MKYSLLSAAAFVAVISSAAPASAQAVIPDPGPCQQIYPNANCLNFGAGNPYTSNGDERSETTSKTTNGWRRSYGNDRRAPVRRSGARRIDR